MFLCGIAEYLESTQSEVHNAEQRCKAFRGIRAGSMRKGCGHVADVRADFHGNLCEKTAENFGAM